MNYRSLLGIALLLCATGCSSAISDRPSSESQSPAVVSQPRTSLQPLVKPMAPTASTPKPPARVSSAQSDLAEKRRIDPPVASSSGSSAVPIKPNPSEAPAATDKNSAETERDYGLTTPIADTGKLTVRNRIRSVDLNKLIAACPTDTAPYALAESTHYRIQICSEEYDPQLPKYYIGQAKDGGGELRITSANLDEARQLIFKNGDYTYTLYREGARAAESNAYLEIYTPDGKSYAEALFYLYE